MPGREEALDRARLARLRQGLNVERTDNTLFRGWADELLREPLSADRRQYRSSLPPEERERVERDLSAGLTGLIATPLAFVAGEGLRQVVPQNALADQERKRVLQRGFGQLDQSLRSDSGKLREKAEVPEFEGSRRQAIPVALSYSGKTDAMGEGLPMAAVDWDRSAQALGRATPDRIATVQNVPETGPDLGSFGRGWDGPDAGNQVAYTVVPNANSSRFAQRLTPALIDQVYSKDARVPEVPAIESGPYAGAAGVGLGGARGYQFDSGLPSSTNQRETARPVPTTRMADLRPEERLSLLEQLAPGQLHGRNQSGFIWGTLTEMPRYREYGGDGYTNNPEVVVSEVRTPPELETRYLYTGDTHDPKVRYKDAPDTRALGPAWGVSEQALAGASLSGRQKRNTAGDISFRGDLIERRGGLSLADAQAVQSKLGLPVTIGREGYPAARALEEAVETIRQAEDLPSHAAVVERYARSLPRLGATTSPRTPATGRVSEMPLDTRAGVTSGLKQAFDLSGALQEAGYEPTKGGLLKANADVADTAARRVAGLDTAVRFAPAVGTVMGLMDPKAAELLGAALREEGPVRTGLARDALRVYGQNALVGGVQGGLVSAAMAAAPRLGLSGLATSAASALPVVAPALAGIAATQTVDGYLKGATGEGLGQHWRRTQRQAKPTQADVVQALVPVAKPVMANTPSGVAQVRPRARVNPVVQEVSNRAALARENFNPLQGEFGLTELLFGRGRARSRRR
jgi:hypothetical protein